MVKNKGGNLVSSPSSSCRVHSAIQALAKDRGSRGSLPESIPPGATNGKENKKAVSLLQLTACFCCGAPEEIRTPGLQVRSLLLYPAELRARREKLCIENSSRSQAFSKRIFQKSERMPEKMLPPPWKRRAVLLPRRPCPTGKTQGAPVIPVPANSACGHAPCRRKNPAWQGTSFCPLR